MNLRPLSPLIFPGAVLVIGLVLIVAGRLSAHVDGFRFYGQIETIGDLVLVLGAGVFAVAAGRLGLEVLARRDREWRQRSGRD